MASLFEKREAAVPTSCDQEHDGNKADEAGLSVAIPLISTEGSPGGYEVNDSATVGTAAALRFLASSSRRNVEGLRVVLVAEEGSSALEALRRQKNDLAALEPRLIVKACALPDVARAGAPCSYIVNPCNWQLVGRGGRTNVLVNKAAGLCLEETCKRAGARVRVADPMPIKLPPESPLRGEGQVETVLQVLGPNIDPRFPDCLKSQPVEARRLLCRAYDNALECFWDLASTAAEGKIPEKGSEKVATGVSKAEEPSDSGKSSVPAASGGCKRSADGWPRRVSNAKPTGCAMFPKYREGPPVPVPSGAGGGNWKTALFKYLQKPRPVSIQREVFYEEEHCVVVYDGYPKAKYHLLLLPKKEVINDARQPDQLRGNHLQALRHLHSVAKSVACFLSASGAGFVRYGYHAIPSLEPLHIHIISQDFDSPCLKTKNHWNSFTTGLFLECSWVEERLVDRGRLGLDLSRYRDLEKQPLRCFRCRAAMPTIPALKEHNHACQTALQQSRNTVYSMGVFPGMNDTTEDATADVNAITIGLDPHANKVVHLLNVACNN